MSKPSTNRPPRSDNPKLRAYLEKFDPKSPQNIKLAKEKRAAQRREWWRENWIAMTGIILAAISLIVGLLK